MHKRATRSRPPNDSAEQSPKAKRPRGTGSILRMKGSRNLWIQWRQRGRTVRESSGTSDWNEAAKILRRKIAESEVNPIDPRDRKILVGPQAEFDLEKIGELVQKPNSDLYTMLLLDYRLNGQKSIAWVIQRWNRRLKEKFGGLRADYVTADTLDRYVAWCLEQGLSAGTINRDLSAIRRAFSLGRKKGKIRDVPTFPHLKESEPRSGFLEDAAYLRLATHAAREGLWARALLATGYAFGFRLSELLNLRVKQVSLPDRTIRLNAGETKSGEGRVVKLTQDVYVLLSACVQRKNPDDYVFTRKKGQPVRDFRGTWHAMCVQAGLGKFYCAECDTEVDADGNCPKCEKERTRDELRYAGLLFHDLRRSAVRNMIRRGVPQVTAMKISGHKTREIFDRYNIVDESDLADAARRIEESRASDFCQSFDRLTSEAVKKQSVPTGSSRAN